MTARWPTTAAWSPHPRCAEAARGHGSKADAGHRPGARRPASRVPRDATLRSGRRRERRAAASARDRAKRACSATAASAAFVAELARRGVAPLSVGASIVATWDPHETTVLEVIRELGLELQVIFNKGAVMVLPPGVNKATRPRAALAGAGAVGAQHGRDRRRRERSALLADGRVLRRGRQRGADAQGEGRHRDARRSRRRRHRADRRLLDNDLRDVLPSREQRHRSLLGTRADGSRVQLAAAGINILVAGTSGSGKSTLATGLLEQLMAARLPVLRHRSRRRLRRARRCDSSSAARSRRPTMAEIFTALEQPATSASSTCSA